MRRATLAFFVAACVFSVATLITLHWTARQRAQPPPTPPAAAAAPAARAPPPPPPPLPRVTIITLSRGQRHCERNSVLNALYQTYPRERLRLLVGDSSDAPSEYYQSWAARPPPPGAGGDADDARAPWRALGVTYLWFNSSAPAGSAANPYLGDLRNLLQDAADAADGGARADVTVPRARWDARDATPRGPSSGMELRSLRASPPFFSQVVMDNDDVYHPR